MFRKNSGSRLAQAILVAGVWALTTASVHAAETIILLRHAEKPEAGLGQLNCQGLNRALALPSVLLRKFGTPSAIYAPNPGIMKADRGIEYNYLRPLATIEPTAIAANLPVNTQFGFDDIGQLKAALMSPQYENATLFVAWEHHMLNKMAHDLMVELGDISAEIPEWISDDFDSLYIISVETLPDGTRKASFRTDYQGLNDMPKSCRNSDSGNTP